MYGPNGETPDQYSEEDDKEEFPRKTPYQVPGVSPAVPPDMIERIVRTGKGSSAHGMRRRKKHIIDQDNRANG